MTDDTDERLDRLEARVEEHQQTIEKQQESIQKQRERMAERKGADAVAFDGGRERARTEEVDGLGDRSRQRSLLQGGAQLCHGRFATAADSTAEPRGLAGAEEDNVRLLSLQRLSERLAEKDVRIDGQPGIRDSQRGIADD